MNADKKKIISLDCTLRDGGYYNNWDFDSSTVKKYVQAINSSKIDYVEIGFRSLPSKNFIGSFAYSSDSFISKLNIKSKIAIMIDTKEVLENKIGIKKTLDILLNDKKKSPVRLVRFATHFKDALSLKNIIKITRQKGYQVAINIMQCSNKSEIEIKKILKYLNKLEGIDVLYFADSLGNMDTNDVKKITKIFKKFWSADLGIHAHNNKGNGVANSLVAIDCGVKWVDSTINGMGRGAGNAETEILLSEINNRFSNKYTMDKIFLLSSIEFRKLKDKYQWGQSLYYYLAAKNNIHPSYIQEMISDQRYDENDILKTIEHIKNIPSTSYNKNFINGLMSKNLSNINKGKWNARNWCKNKTVLILGGGSNITKYKNNIIQYSKKKSVLILSLNYISQLDQYIHGIIVANKPRYMMDSKNYSKLKKPIYICQSIYKDDPNFHLFDKFIYNYGLNIKAKKFAFYKNYSYTPNNLAFSYALSLVNMGKAKKILVAGFDGYDDPVLQKQMISTINCYNKVKKKLEIKSITPTSYPLEIEIVH